MAQNDEPSSDVDTEAAEEDRRPGHYLRQLSEGSLEKLRDRICRKYSVALRRNHWEKGRCVDPVVNDAAQEALGQLLVLNSALKDAPQPFKEGANDANDWEHQVVDALARYVSGTMVQGITKTLLQTTGIIFPRNWGIHNSSMSSLSDFGHLNDRDRGQADVERQDQKYGWHKANPNYKPKDTVVTILSGDVSDLENVDLASVTVRAQYVKLPIDSGHADNPLGQLEAKETERIAGKRIDFFKRVFKTEPSVNILFRLLCRLCSDKTICDQVYLKNGKSDSYNHEFILSYLPGWSKKDLTKALNRLLEAKHDKARKRRLSRDFSKFLEHDLSERENPPAEHDPADADLSAQPPAPEKSNEGDEP